MVEIGPTCQQIITKLCLVLLDALFNLDQTKNPHSGIGAKLFPGRYSERSDFVRVPPYNLQKYQRQYPTSQLY